MIKLNLTEAQVISYMFGVLAIRSDWCEMYSELARLNKAIEEAVEEIKNISIFQIDEGNREGDMYEVKGMTLDILRKHGLVKEDNNVQ